MNQRGIDILEGYLTRDIDDHYGDIKGAIEAIDKGSKLREHCSLFSISS